jgi:hypothetical protein
MAKQSELTEPQVNKKNQPQVEQTTLAEQTSELAGLSNLLGGSTSAASDGMITGHVDRLNDPEIQIAQRRAMASQIGSMQGNQHLQMVMTSLGQKPEHTVLQEKDRARNDLPNAQSAQPSKLIYQHTPDVGISDGTQARDKNEEEIFFDELNKTQPDYEPSRRKIYHAKSGVIQTLVPLKPPPQRPRRSTGADWRGSIWQQLQDELRWELGLVDDLDILDRALDLTRRNPFPHPNVRTIQDAFFFWLGWRVPWAQAGRGGNIGRLILRLRRLGVRNVRTLSGLRKNLIRIFRVAVGRQIELNLHVARRFIERCARVGSELEGVTFTHLQNAIKFGKYFRDATNGNVIAVLGRIAIVITVRGGGGKVIIRTIESATQFTGKVGSRFTSIPKPF